MSEETESNSEDSKRPWFEPVTALLMAVATLTSAWCSYQSSRWSGDSGGHSDEMSRLERRATELHLEGLQVESAHLALVTQWLDAHLNGQEKVAAFYLSRFPPPLRAAYDAWIAEKPFENPASDPHPLVPRLYKVPFADEAKTALADAATHSVQADITARHAGGYLRNTVLLATVLFFAGTASRFDKRWVRQSTLAFALSIFAYAMWRMIELPVT